MNTNKRIVGYSLFALFVFLIDRLTKSLVLAHIQQTKPVTSFFSVTCVFNRGVSWGMMHSESTMQFLLVSGLVIIMLSALSWYAYTQFRAGHVIIGEVMAIAGAGSNLVDRIMYGGVVDFIILHWNSWSFPVFNIADVCIVVGIGLMILSASRE